MKRSIIPNGIIDSRSLWYLSTILTGCRKKAVNNQENSCPPESGFLD